MDKHLGGFIQGDDVTSEQVDWVRNYINEMSSALGTENYDDYIDTLSWVDHHLL